jgi:histone-lysine N-methyltransferase SETMAR
VDDENLLTLVKDNPCRTTTELGNTLGCSKSTISEHLHQLGCVWKWEQWIPPQLSADQKQMRVTICSSLLSRQAIEPFLDRIVTQDEKWVP